MYGTIIIVNELELVPVGETCVLNFTGKTIEHMKNSTTGQYDKVIHNFSFEVWDSAAQFIKNNAKVGDTLFIYSATPKERRWVNKEGKSCSRVMFRVNKFELCQQREGSSND